jgi:hypothetical protein
VAQFTPDERDRARERVGTATATMTILAVGAAGAASILAWHATTQASTAQSNGTAQVQQGSLVPLGDDQAQSDDQGGSLSLVPGDGNLPNGGIQGAAPPGPASGGGVVGSQGS